MSIFEIGRKGGGRTHVPPRKVGGDLSVLQARNLSLLVERCLTNENSERPRWGRIRGQVSYGDESGMVRISFVVEIAVDNALEKTDPGKLVGSNIDTALANAGLSGHSVSTRVLRGFNQPDPFEKVYRDGMTYPAQVEVTITLPGVRRAAIDASGRQCR